MGFPSLRAPAPDYHTISVTLPPAHICKTDHGGFFCPECGRQIQRLLSHREIKKRIASYPFKIKVGPDLLSWVSFLIVLALAIGANGGTTPREGMAAKMVVIERLLEDMYTIPVRVDRLEQAEDRRKWNSPCPTRRGTRRALRQAAKRFCNES